MRQTPALARNDAPVLVRIRARTSTRAGGPGAVESSAQHPRFAASSCAIRLSSGWAHPREVRKVWQAQARFGGNRLSPEVIAWSGVGEETTFGFDPAWDRRSCPNSCRSYRAVAAVGQPGFGASMIYVPAHQSQDGDGPMAPLPSIQVRAPDPPVTCASPLPRWLALVRWISTGATATLAGGIAELWDTSFGRRPLIRVAARSRISPE